MNHSRSTRVDDAGYALMTVVVFTFIIGLCGMAFFAMASHETNQAIYREESAEAFALADGAIERARARFLVDRLWTAGFDTTTGRGSYTLDVERIPYTDPLGVTHDQTVRLLASGTVGRATRNIEVYSALPLTAYGLMFLVCGTMTVQGNMNIYGGASHINDVADFGRDDVHLREGSYTSGFTLLPPVAQTDPIYYPGATYYRVRACDPGGNLHARVEWWDPGSGNYVDVTTAKGDSLDSVIAPDGTNFYYGFLDPAVLRHYFDVDSGIFNRVGGDATVIVNFGEPPVPSATLDPTAVSSVDFKAQGAYIMRSTIINTRCWNPAAPLESTSWEGGLTTIKLMDMEPINGLGLLVHDFMTEGMSGCSMGTDEWPSLTYVTGDVVDLNANGEIWGSIIVLGSWGDPTDPTTGGPDLHFDPDFQLSLPEYLGTDWGTGGSSTMHVLSWREVAADS
ncbi:MAG: hypothetical protein R6X25_05850 [Candidatus Krumholzibacteriia bacterium]